MKSREGWGQTYSDVRECREKMGNREIFMNGIPYMKKEKYMDRKKQGGKKERDRDRDKYRENEG